MATDSSKLKRIQAENEQRKRSYMDVGKSTLNQSSGGHSGGGFMNTANNMKSNPSN